MALCLRNPTVEEKIYIWEYFFAIDILWETLAVCPIGVQKNWQNLNTHCAEG